MSRRTVIWFASAAAVLIILLSVGLLLGKGPAKAEDSKTEGREAAAGLAASSGGLVNHDEGSGPAETEPDPEAEPQLDEPREPVPVGDPEVQEPPVPEPSPEPEPKAPRKARPAPKKDTPSVDCERVVADAKAASRDRRWGRVLQLTKSTRCWDDRSARVRLRMEALLESGSFRECVELGRKTKKPELVRMAESCAKQLGKETSP